MPNELFAYCGLQCVMCPAYVATQSGSDEEKEKVAKEWSAQFKHEFKAEDINCDGCKSKGVKFSHCNVCEIRACAMEKGIDNCGVCSEYACGKLDHIFAAMPAAKNILDTVHEAMSA